MCVCVYLAPNLWQIHRCAYYLRAVKDVALSSTQAAKTTTATRNENKHSGGKQFQAGTETKTATHRSTDTHTHTYFQRKVAAAERDVSLQVCALCVCVLCGHCSRSFCTFCGTTLYQRHLTDCKGRGAEEGERERGEQRRQAEGNGNGSAVCFARAAQDPHSSQKCQSHVYGRFPCMCAYALYNTVCVCVSVCNACVCQRRGISFAHFHLTHCLLKWHFKVRSLLAQHKFPLFHFASFLQLQQQQRQQQQQQRLLLTCIAVGFWRVAASFRRRRRWRLRLSLIFAALFSAFSDFRGIYINRHTLTYTAHTQKHSLSHTHTPPHTLTGHSFTLHICLAFL